MLKKIKHYFFAKWSRIIFHSLKGFISHQCSLRASSLTYYTIMSIVPILALAFWITQGFGFYERFQEQIITRFPEQKEAFTELFEFAGNLLDQMRGGVLASVGLFILCLTAIFLCSHLEKTLNHIWGVYKRKKWWRIAIDYVALMIFAPLFFVFASSFLNDKLEAGVRLLPISQAGIGWLVFVVNLIPYCLFWVLFTFLYFFIPNTKVHVRSAFVAGVLTGTIYLIFQWAYIYFQIIVAHYGAIYGSMAAIPLFLIWIKLSWSLFLLGAELSHAHQTFTPR